MGHSGIYIYEPREAKPYAPFLVRGSTKSPVIYISFEGASDTGRWTSLRDLNSEPGTLNMCRAPHLLQCVFLPSLQWMHATLLAHPVTDHDVINAMAQTDGLEPFVAIHTCNPILRGRIATSWRPAWS